MAKRTVKKESGKRKKTAAKAAHVTRAVKTAKTALPKKTTTPQHSELHGLSVKVFDTKGAVKGHMTLPEEIFHAKTNRQLILQAIRVYLANQREGSASTKTRGEVEGSTRKIYRQKGTGRARHGGIRAPIFVGGGITFGPAPRDYSLSMPAAMKQKALAGALTLQNDAGAIFVIDGLESLEKKTNAFAKALHAVCPVKKTLLVVTSDAHDIVRCTRNIAGLDSIPATNINTYAVMAHAQVIFMKNAVSAVKDHFAKKQ